MTLRIVWSRRAIRDAGRVDQQALRRIAAALERYATTEQGDVVRLSGLTPPELRLRVGDYRIRFHLEGGLLEVLRVAHRRDLYR